MKLEKDAIVKGRVTSITKFGAFVELPNGKSGLVYISEITNAFVKNISDYLSVGQEVTVKVLSIDGSKINLSIKQAAEPPKPEPAEENQQNVSVDHDFEDKLKHFMKISDSKQSDIKRHSERHGSRKRR